MKKTLLQKKVGQAIFDYCMIENGDRVMVCLSGGKDSYVLLTILQELKAKAPIHFELLVVNVDQKQPGFPKEVLPHYLKEKNVPFRIVDEDTYSIVKKIIPENKTMCSLCSRLRRGVLYRISKEENCNKIALGHHADDIMETFFLNLFYTGSLNTMPPKLLSNDKKHTVIRPLAYCFEEEIEEFSNTQKYPIIPCTLCGSQSDLKRKKIKSWLKELKKENPKIHFSILNSLGNVQIDRLLDRRYLNIEFWEDFVSQNSAQLEKDWKIGNL